MNKNPIIKPTLAMATLGLLPPLLRNTMIEDTAFQEEFSIVPDAEITFGVAEEIFQRSYIYNSVREFLSDSLEKQVQDKNGQIWRLRNLAKAGELPKLSLSNRNNNINLSFLTFLSKDKKVRVSYFNKIANEVNLPSLAQEQWRNILEEREIKDTELDALRSDFNDTPFNQERLIRNAILNKSINISSLIPNSRRYFERLIGNFDGSSSIHKYALGVGKTHFEQLSMWSHYDGFLYSLLLSSHLSLTEEIRVEKISSDDLIRAFEFLEHNGDIISKFGAVEVGLRILKSRTEIEPILIRIIQQLCKENPDDDKSGFNLIFALFVFVDGELSRNRLFISEPPYYRRLAALSHAALIYRQIIRSNIDIESFRNWVLGINFEQFYIQSLVDARIEPRWYPDFAAPSQLKLDFFGRLLIIASNYKENLSDTLYNIIFSDNAESVNSFVKYPFSYYPGPLEGGRDTLNTMPKELSEIIKKQLVNEQLGVKSYASLINSVLIFPVNIEYAEIAANTIKESRYQLNNLKDQSQLMVILDGLATVAAVTKSMDLVKEIQILVRIYRHDTQFRLSIGDSVRICLIAASSYDDLVNWSDLVGEWLTELAFCDLEEDEGTLLFSYLEILCDTYPELCITCGRAKAALLAYIGRKS